MRTLIKLGTALAVFVTLFFVTRTAEAFPWMIRHDYTACTTCHADPSGAGLLTLYGRAQSEVILRTQWGKENPDEDPGKLGGFGFGLVPLPEWLSLQADARSLLLHVIPPGKDTSTTRLILMQADAAAGLSLGQFRASGSLGYIHEGALGASVTRGTADPDDGNVREDRLISRQHWAGFAFGEDDSLLLRAGRMNLPFGLRIIEHTSFVRSSTRTDVNAAQQHGVALSYNKSGIRAELMGIAGNFQLRPDELRERGGVGYFEYAFKPTLAAGLTSLVTYADRDLELQTPSVRQAHGLFGRYAPVKPVVIMAEADLLIRSPKRADTTIGSTGILQVDVEPLQGVHLAATGELLTQRFEDTVSLGGWLSAFWFFLPHVDVRADFVQRSLPGPEGRIPVSTLLAQIHGFL